MEDFHESLQLEEYIALCRQDIAIDITVAEMACLHSLLLKYREDIVSASVALFVTSMCDDLYLRKDAEMLFILLLACSTTLYLLHD